MDNNVLEFMLLEFLSATFILMPIDFWEPVKVSLSNSQINNLINLNIFEECTICYESCQKFKEMSCCKNKICISCTKKWFNETDFMDYSDITRYYTKLLRKIY